MHSNNKSIRPQNESCPAGGTNQAQAIKSKSKSTRKPRDKSGVIITCHSRNSSKGNLPEYTVVHRGFDTLALSVKQSISIATLELLTKEKEVAEAERRETLIAIEGWKVHLKPHGGKGYEFILSDGETHATWALKKPNAKDPWGVRVSIGSFFLATAGLGKARAYIDATLERLGIRYMPTDISIARIDYCVDILAPQFTLIPENFVMHARTKRKDHIATSDQQVDGISGRVQTVTIGKTPGRQIVTYDKRAEIITHHKTYWWDLWYNTLHREGGDPYAMYILYSDEIRADPTKSRVWRIEIRAGKDLLKDRWNIRTWEDLFARYGDLIREAFEVVRYTIPNGDKNRARWPNHPIWNIAQSEMNTEMFEMREGADPNPLKQIQKEEKARQLEQLILGTTISHAALNGQSFETLPEYFKQVGTVLGDRIKTDPERYAKQLDHANDKYVFVRSATGKGDRGEDYA